VLRGCRCRQRCHCRVVGAAGRGGIRRPISVFLPSSLVFRPVEQERATEAAAVDIGRDIHACRILRVEWVIDVECCEYQLLFSSSVSTCVVCCAARIVHYTVQWSVTASDWCERLISNFTSLSCRLSGKQYMTTVCLVQLAKLIVRPRTGQKLSVCVNQGGILIKATGNARTPGNRGPP